MKKWVMAMVILAAAALLAGRLVLGDSAAVRGAETEGEKG